MKKEQSMHEIVREAVHETLKGIGIDPNAPHEMQADFIYMRKMRKGSELMASRIKTSVITVIIPAFIYMIWDGLKDVIGR